MNTIPQTTNPVKEVRLAKNMTLMEFAHYCGVTESTLRRTEDGCYVTIPPRILRAIHTDTVHPSLVRSQYTRYQTSKRLAVLEQKLNIDVSVERLFNLSARFTGWYMGSQLDNPFVYWRLTMGWKTRYDFCVDTCMNPTTLKRYEDGVCVTIPRQLVKVLEELKVDWRGIHTAYVIWRTSGEYKRTSVREPRAIIAAGW